MDRPTDGRMEDDKPDNCFVERGEAVILHNFSVTQL